MVEDERGSRKPRSGTETINSGATSPTTLINLREEESMSVEEVVVQYDSTATTAGLVEMYDEPDGTSQADLSDKVDEFRVDAGDNLNPDMVWEDIEDDVVILPDGNNDADITVTVGGYTISG